jgi:hypothetical protein
MRYAMRTLYTDSNLFASPSAVELRWLFLLFQFRFGMNVLQSLIRMSALQVCLQLRAWIGKRELGNRYGPS